MSLIFVMQGKCLFQDISRPDECSCFIEFIKRVGEEIKCEACQAVFLFFLKCKACRAVYFFFETSLKQLNNTGA